jgi:hypothetical protein
MKETAVKKAMSAHAIIMIAPLILRKHTKFYHFEVLPTISERMNVSAAWPKRQQ